MSKKLLFTSESVTEGHPDKVCDAISDAVLDAALAGDPASRVACETLVTTDYCCIAGEITTKTSLGKEVVEALARKTINRIGYTSKDVGFSGDTCRVDVRLHTQSPDISRGVSREREEDQGAGDQGMMFGYATDETEILMPMPIHLAHRLVERLSAVRRSGEIDYLRPDGKSQVTVEYQDDKPVAVTAVVVSTQHAPSVSERQDVVRADIIAHVIRPVLGDLYREGQTVVHVNPTGRFEVGGPHGDSGLTGRKIIVDTYGGMGRHGGGAFSGKDPSKVDRSAAYAMRHVAKNIVAAKLAKRCEVQVAYAIGVAEPVSLSVDTFGTGELSDEALAGVIREVFDLRPRAIIRRLNLLRPIYSPTSAYGHFGRTGESFTWESLDMVEALTAAARQIA